MNFTVSAEARRDLWKIWAYSQQQWGTEQADLYVDSLVLRMAWLAENRELWRPRPDIKEGVFSWLESRDVVFFFPRRRGIDILRVLHCRMDPSERLA